MTNLVTLDELLALKGLTPGAQPLFDADTLDVAAGHTPQHVVIHAGSGASIKRVVDALNPLHEPLTIDPPKDKDTPPVNRDYPLPSYQAIAAAGGTQAIPEGRMSGLPSGVMGGKGGTAEPRGSQKASKASSSSRGKAKTQTKAQRDARAAENRVSSDETKTTTSTAKSETPASARTDPGQASAAPKPVEADRETGRASGEVPKPDEAPTKREASWSSHPHQGGKNP